MRMCVFGNIIKCNQLKTETIQRNIQHLIQIKIVLFDVLEQHSCLAGSSCTANTYETRVPINLIIKITLVRQIHTPYVKKLLTFQLSELMLL